MFVQQPPTHCLNLEPPQSEESWQRSLQDLLFLVLFDPIDLLGLGLGGGRAIRAEVTGDPVGLVVMGALLGVMVEGTSVGLSEMGALLGAFVVGASVGFAVMGASIEAFIVGASVGFGAITAGQNAALAVAKSSYQVE